MLGDTQPLPPAGSGMNVIPTQSMIIHNNPQLTQALSQPISQGKSVSEFEYHSCIFENVCVGVSAQLPCMFDVL